jgi:hypothetical protein
LENNYKIRAKGISPKTGVTMSRNSRKKKTRTQKLRKKLRMQLVKSKPRVTGDYSEHTLGARAFLDALAGNYYASKSKAVRRPTRQFSNIEKMYQKPIECGTKPQHGPFQLLRTEVGLKWYPQY